MNKIIVSNALNCPVCEADLGVQGNSLLCERGHCFDIASAGYVNLATAKQSGGGDSKELVAARTAFLSAGYYERFADAICERAAHYARGGIIIDAGCGEGYYSLRAARAAEAAVCGFDLSKFAVMAAAKAARRQGIDAAFAVAGIFNMPLKDGCADAVMNLFAPCAAQEFCRVLKVGGYLIVAGAGEHHLQGLKGVIYDNVTKNETRADLPNIPSLCLREQARVRYDISLRRHEDIMALFSMTPYFYRTSEAGRAALEATDRLETTVDFDIFVYQKV